MKTWYLFIGFISLLMLPSSLQSKEPLSPTFDCNGTLSRVEKVICHDQNLIALDQVLGTLYSTSMKEKKERKERNLTKTLRNYQRAWIRQRATCKNTPCITQSYHSRIKELQEIQTPKTLVIDEKKGLNGINAQTAFSIDALKKHLPTSYRFKKHTYPCKKQLCVEIEVINHMGNKVMIVGAEKEHVAYIIAVDESIHSSAKHKIGDLLQKSSFGKDNTLYQEHCQKGKGIYAGFITCKSSLTTPHLTYIYKGFYEKADVSLPPLDVAKTYKIFAIIWEK